MSLKGLLIAVLMLGSVLASAAPARTPPKVVLVIFENTQYAKALAQPFFAKVAGQGALLTRYFAITHPSQPNYLALTAGSTMGVANDDLSDVKGGNIADLLERKGKSWHVYAESFPGKCFAGGDQGPYTRRHNPMISYSDIRNSPKRCAHITDASSFASDFKSGKLADFSIFIPNVKDDGHDTGVAFANQWFEKTFSDLIADQKAMKHTLLIVTFDEDDAGTKENQVYTAIVGGSIKPGTLIADRHDHYDLLRTVESLLRIGNLGRADAKAKAIAF